VAWSKTINAAGGINGHPVQLITKDDAGNPGTALTDAKAIISDHVVAIVDDSQLDAVWASAVQATNIPVVGGFTSNSPFGTNPDFYPQAQTNDSAIDAVISTAKAAGATNLANVYCAESPICAQSVPAFKTTGSQLGVPVTYNAEVSATAPNYTAQCVAAQQQHVTSVFIGDASTVITRIAADCSRQGYNPIFVVEGAGFGLVEAPAAGLKNGLWVEFPAIPFFDSSNAGVQASNTAMDKYFPGVRENANLYNEDSFMGWIAGVLLEHAVKAGGLTAGGAPSAAEIVSGLGTLKGDTLGGLTSPLSFTASKANNVSCWFTGRVENSTPALVGSGQPTCQKAS
jgi:branched-chain amino acid transport system substrate-binding protein